MTTPGQDSVHDLAAAYVLGALSSEEVQRFEALLVTSPEAQREVAELRDAAALMALGQAGAAPSPDLRDRVMARVSQSRSVAIANTGSLPGRRRVPPLLWGALAASLVAAAGLGYTLTGLRKDVTDLRQAAASRDATLAQRQKELDEREATINSLLEPGVRLYQLTASADPEPGMQLFWDQRHNTAIINGYRLKPVPSGQEYQLWFIKDGKPIPSVTFTPGPGGGARIERIPVPAGGAALSAAAVTVEPAGGSQAPTSKPVMVGALKQS